MYVVGLSVVADRANHTNPSRKLMIVGYMYTTYVKCCRRRKLLLFGPATGYNMQLLKANFGAFKLLKLIFP